MRFRQVELLLHAVAQAHAQPFAAPEGDQCLAELVAGAELVGPGIDEVGQALEAVGLAGHHHHADHHHANDHRQEAQQADAAEKQHGDAGADQHHGGAEVRLGEQQAGHQAEHDQRHEQTLPFVLHVRLPAYQVAGQIDHGEQLGQLGGLDVGDTEADPAPRAVDLAANARHQHQHQQDQGGDQQLAAVLLPGGHRHQQHHAGGSEADGQVDQVADHVIQRIARLRRRHLGRGGGDHHEAETEQRQATRQQREVQIDAAATQQR
ncbi:hypothetical protein D9M71_242790 [compost metagenome]